MLACQSSIFSDFIGAAIRGKGRVLQLIAKKTGNCQNKIDTFLQFSHSVKPSYER
jgi:hypothetical protein